MNVITSIKRDEKAAETNKFNSRISPNIRGSEEYNELLITLNNFPAPKIYYYTYWAVGCYLLKYLHEQYMDLFSIKLSWIEHNFNSTSAPKNFFFGNYSENIQFVTICNKGIIPPKYLQATD